MERNLYLVQDDDRPIYVLAASWMEAVDRWKAKIIEENAPDITHPSECEPDGVQLICAHDSILD